MSFRGTSLDVTTLLVVALAIVAVVSVIRKRYQSNLPLFFYFIALVFSNVTERGMNPYLLYAGLMFALLLRFEFMGHGFSKFIAFLSTSSLCLIIWGFLADVFGDGGTPF